MTIETEAKIQAVSSSVLCKFFRGTARATEVTGKVIGTAGVVSGTALIAAGDAIVNGSRTVRDKSEVIAENLRKKADRYDLSEFSTEELAEMIRERAEVEGEI